MTTIKERVPEIVVSEEDSIVMRSRFIAESVRRELIAEKQIELATVIANARDLKILLAVCSQLPLLYIWERTDSVLWLPAIANILHFSKAPSSRSHLGELLRVLEYLLVEAVAEAVSFLWIPLIDVLHSLVQEGDWNNVFLCLKVIRKFAQRKSAANKLTRLSLLKGDQNALGDQLAIPYAVADINPNSKEWLERIGDDQATENIENVCQQFFFGLESVHESLSLPCLGSSEPLPVMAVGRIVSLPQTAVGESIKRAIAKGEKQTLQLIQACRLVALDTAIALNPKVFTSQLAQYPSLLSDCISVAVRTDCDGLLCDCALSLLARLARDTSHSDSVSNKIGIFDGTGICHKVESMMENGRPLFPVLMILASRAVSFAGLSPPVIASGFMPWIPSALEYIRSCPADNLVMRHSCLALLRLLSLIVEKGGGASFVRFLSEKGAFSILNDRLNADLDLSLSTPHQMEHTICVRANLRLVEISFEALSSGGRNPQATLSFYEEFIPSLGRIFDNPVVATEGTVSVAAAALGCFISHNPSSVSQLVKTGVIDSLVHACVCCESTLASPESVTTIAQCIEAICLHEEGEKALERLGSPLYSVLIPKFIHKSASQLMSMDSVTSEWNAGDVMGQTLDELIRNRPNTQRERVLETVWNHIRECSRESITIDGLNEICRMLQTMCMNAASASWFIERGLVGHILSLASMGLNFTHAAPSHGICRLFKSLCQLSSQVQLGSALPGGASAAFIHSWPAACADHLIKEASEIFSDNNPIDSIESLLNRMSRIHLILHTCALAIKDVPPPTNHITVEQFNRILNELSVPRSNAWLLDLLSKEEAGGSLETSVSILSLIARLSLKYAGSSTDPKTKTEDEKELRRRLRDDRRCDEQVWSVYHRSESITVELIKGLWMAVRGFMCQVARVVNYPSVPRVGRRQASMHSGASPQAREAGRLLAVLAIDTLNLAKSSDAAKSEAVDLICRLHVEDKHHMTRPICVDEFYKFGGVDHLVSILRVSTASDVTQTILWWFERTTSLKRMNNAQLTFQMAQQEGTKFDPVGLVASLQHDFAIGFLPLWRSDEALSSLSAKAAASLLKALTHVLEPNEKMLKAGPCSPPSAPAGPETDDTNQDDSLMSRLISWSGTLFTEPSPSSPVVSGIRQDEKSYVWGTEVVAVARDAAVDFIERAIVLGSSDKTSPFSAQTHLADVCVRLSHNGVLKLGPPADEDTVVQLQEEVVGGRWRAGTVTLTAEDLEATGGLRTDLASIETEGVGGEMDKAVFSSYNARHITRICIETLLSESSSERGKKISSHILACILHARGPIVKDIVDTSSLIELLNKTTTQECPSWLTNVLVIFLKLKVWKRESPLSIVELMARLLYTHSKSLEMADTESVFRLMHQSAIACLERGLYIDSIIDQYKVVDTILNLQKEVARFDGMAAICLNVLIGGLPEGHVCEAVASEVVRCSILGKLIEEKQVETSMLIETARKDATTFGIHGMDLNPIIKKVIGELNTIVRRLGRPKRQKTTADDSMLIELVDPSAGGGDLKPQFPTEFPPIFQKNLRLLAEALVGYYSDPNLSLHRVGELGEKSLLAISNLCKQASFKFFGGRSDDVLKPLSMVRMTDEDGVTVGEYLCDKCIPLFANRLENARLERLNVNTPESAVAFMSINTVSDLFISKVMKEFGESDGPIKSLWRFLSSINRRPVTVSDLGITHKCLQATRAHDQLPQLKHWIYSTLKDIGKTTELAVVEGLVECLEIATRPPISEQEPAPRQLTRSSRTMGGGSTRRRWPAADDSVSLTEGGAALHRLVEALQENGATVVSATAATNGGSSDSGIMSVGIVQTSSSGIEEEHDSEDLLGDGAMEDDAIPDSAPSTDAVRDVVRRILSPLVASDVAIQFPRFYTNRRRTAAIGSNREMVSADDFLNASPSATSALFAEVGPDLEFTCDDPEPREHSLIRGSHTGASHTSENNTDNDMVEFRDIISDLNNWLQTNVEEASDEIIDNDNEDEIEEMEEETDEEDDDDVVVEEMIEEEERLLASQLLTAIPSEETVLETGIAAIANAARRYGMTEDQLIQVTGIDPSVLRDLPEYMHDEIVREQLVGVRPMRRRPPLAPRPTMMTNTDNASIRQLMGQLELLTGNTENLLFGNMMARNTNRQDNGFLIVDSTSVPQQRAVSSTRLPTLHSNSGGGPKISAATVDAVCDLYKSSPPPLPIDSVNTLVNLLWPLRGSASGQLALENLLFNMALHGDTRKAVLEELIGHCEALKNDTSGTSQLCEKFTTDGTPLVVVKQSMASILLEVLHFLVNHIPLTFDDLSMNLNRLIGLLKGKELNEQGLDGLVKVLTVLLVPETQAPTTRRHRQKGHSDSKVDKLQRALTPESLGDLTEIATDRPGGMKIISSLLGTDTHAENLLISISVLISRLALGLRMVLDQGQRMSQDSKSMGERLVDVLSMLRDASAPNLHIEDQRDRIVSESDDLRSLWFALDRALSAGHEETLVPVIEAFIISHTEDLTTTTAQSTDTRVSSPDDFLFRTSSSRAATPAMRSDGSSKTGRLIRFVERHRKCINSIIREKSSASAVGSDVLLKPSFTVIIKRCPWAIDFDNKRMYFRRQLVPLERPPIKLSVRRSEVFMDSFHQLRHRSSNEMKGKVSVQFTGEEGVDAGGLVREWFSILAREVFNPNYALFRTAGGKASTFHPNPMSWVNPDHLSFFQFCGRIMGKALFDDQRLDAYFTRSFYKRMLGTPVTWMDFEVEDPEYYKQLQWVLSTDLGSDEAASVVEHLTFSVDVEEFGSVRSVALIAGGCEIPVTEENKRDYVRLVCEYKMLTATEPQVESFLEGFHELIPSDLVGSLFDDKELELLISGLPTIDLSDLRANTDYVNYSSSAPQIQWLWKVLETEFSQEQLAWFLQFVTGSAQVPLEGFKALTGMRGPQKFSIHKAYGGDRLPTAHTCFNQLDLPEYESEQILREKLIKAVTEAHEGFGFI